MASRSMLSLWTSTGTLPTACTPSTAKKIPRSLAILPISAMGLITPISLLAYMMVIKIVVGFGGTAGEDNPLRGGVNQRSHLLTRVFHGFLGGPPEGVVAARRIPELPGEIRQHRLQHPGIDRSGGVIVHVNRQFNGHVPLLSS